VDDILPRLLPLLPAVASKLLFLLDNTWLGMEDSNSRTSFSKWAFEIWPEFPPWAFI
jgi:hypothetical protein